MNELLKIDKILQFYGESYSIIRKNGWYFFKSEKYNFDAKSLEELLRYAIILSTHYSYNENLILRVDTMRRS